MATRTAGERKEPAAFDSEWTRVGEVLRTDIS
jgi:hypothetical protein